MLELTEMVDPILLTARKEIHDPELTKLITDKLLSSRANDLMDSVEPRRDQLTMLKLPILPTKFKPYMDNELPSLIAARRDKTEPRDIMFSAVSCWQPTRPTLRELKLDPRAINCNRENFEPSRLQFLIDMLDPSSPKSTTDRRITDPVRCSPARLRDEPTRLIHLNETPDANPPHPYSDTLPPVLTHLRNERDEPIDKKSTTDKLTDRRCPHRQLNAEPTEVKS